MLTLLVVRAVTILREDDNCNLKLYFEKRFVSLDAITTIIFSIISILYSTSADLNYAELVFFIFLDFTVGILLSKCFTYQQIISLSDSLVKDDIYAEDRGVLVNHLRPVNLFLVFWITGSIVEVITIMLGGYLNFERFSAAIAIIVLILFVDYLAYFEIMKKWNNTISAKKE